MVVITREKKSKIEKSERLSWDVNPGDLVLIVSDRSSSVPVFGIFEEINNEDRLICLQQNSAYRLSVAKIGNQIFPDLSKIPEDKYNSSYVRSIDTIDEITIGREAIAKRLRKLNPAYESYASLIEKIEFSK